MIFAKNPGHELIDVEKNHILIVMAIELTNILGNLFYFTSLFNEINVNDTILVIKNIIILFFK